MAPATSATDAPIGLTLADLLAQDGVLSRLASRFADAGHELYLVGGVVRDALLRRPLEGIDIDFATGASPEATKAIVEPMADSVWLQGMAYGTVGARLGGVNVEITTFRTESYQPASRHPEVAFQADIETDLSRRDFTINAMAVRLPDRKRLDPFGGAKDVTARLLRTPIDPRESFSDDPLRMLRAFRFASQLGFSIEEGALEAIAELKELILSVSAERIRDELSRLLQGAAPAAALEAAERVGLTDLFLPELGALKLEQDPVQRHKDVFRHTLAVVERTDPDRVLRLAALLHDIGKPKTRRIDPDGVSFHQHEVVGARMAAARLRELRYPGHDVHDVSELIRLHHRFHTYSLGWTDSAVRRYVRDAGPLLRKLNDLVRADCTTRNPAKAKRLAARMDELEERVKELQEREELGRIRPELDGHQIMTFLGAPPGPIVGEALAWLLELRLEEGLLGQEAAYARLREWSRVRGIEPGVQGSPEQAAEQQRHGPRDQKGGTES